MDDVKTFKVVFNGSEFEATPFTSDQIAALALIRTGSDALTLRIIGSLLAKSIGEEHWETLAVALAMGETTLEAVTDLLKDIATRTAEILAPGEK